MKEKVILAYSGGLDTTAMIPWLKENFDYDSYLLLRKLRTGRTNWTDWKKEQNYPALLNYISKISQMSSVTITLYLVYRLVLYMSTNIFLGTAMARPGIAKKLVEIARKENAVAICHGATGKGNDQIRFELGIKALAPDIKIIAPWRDDKWTDGFP